MKIQVLVAAMVLAGGTAFAQAPAPVTAPKDSTAMPRVDARQANQEKRIEQGVASGQLTPKETQRLEKGEARIEKAEAHAKADGVVTKQERHRLAEMQNHESRAIARQKHDGQRDMDHDGKRDRHPAGHPRK